MLARHASPPGAFTKAASLLSTRFPTDCQGTEVDYQTSTFRWHPHRPCPLGRSLSQLPANPVTGSWIPTPVELVTGCTNTCVPR